MIDQASTVRTDVVEFSLLGVIQRVAQGKYLMLATSLLGLLVGWVVLHHTKPFYWSQAVFLPPHASDLASSASSLFGGGGDASDVYLGLLVSRGVQDDVIDHLGLMSIYHAPNHTVARAILNENTALGVGRNALIFVNVKADNPKLAAQIANQYLDALYRLNGQMASSSSSHREAFYQQQVDLSRASLTRAENALKETEERTGFVLPGSEAEAGVSAAAQTQSQINGAEGRLAGLLVSETDQNPEVIQARAQLAQLRGLLDRQIATGTKSVGVPSTKQLPALTLEYQEKEREVRQNEAAYESLLQQSAKARLAAIDPGPQLEIVDRAVPAEFQAGPDRNLYLERGFGFGLLAGFLYLLLFDPLRHLLFTIRAQSAAVSR